MQTAILVLHIIICVFLIMLVLLQAGREGMGVIFGGGGNSSVFGSQGAGGVLTKLTAFLAILFVVTSLGYNIMFSSNQSSNESVLDVQFEEPIANPAGTSVPAPIESTEPKAVEAPATQTPEANKEAAEAPTASEVTEEQAPASTTETVEAPVAIEATEEQAPTSTNDETPSEAPANAE